MTKVAAAVLEIFFRQCCLTILLITYTPLMDDSILQAICEWSLGGEESGIAKLLLQAKF